ncbi:hypothetical protein SESBI_26276 [Sesbania bispinosa]|nr:hypothetical protein SESBI_26276 [Sesbania bispinosa]
MMRERETRERWKREREGVKAREESREFRVGRCDPLPVLRTISTTLPSPNRSLTETTEKLKAASEAQTTVCDLKAEVDDHKMKFLNPGVELRTRGMSTLCMVQDGKWYQDEVDGNVPCSLGDEETTSSVLTTNE